MLAKINSYALNGLDGYGVTVEVDIHMGLPSIDVVGLPDTAIKESRERVRSAIKNSGYDFSPRKITVNLAPAHTKKEGPIFDLAIALGMLVSTEQAGVDERKTPLKSVNDYVFLGELSLSGEVARVNGVMPMLIAAREQGVKKIVIPKANVNEAKYIRGIEVYAVESLRDAVALINGETRTPVESCDVVLSGAASGGEDLKYVKGQYAAKRALEIAAAGGHNIIMIGSPGGGKTMLAKCLPTILPDMTEAEALETTKIHSVAGILDESSGRVPRGRSAVRITRRAV
ncbi:MAG: ATP-binding protein [Clostridiales bacterium]|nr:ATP-binding protein [Clostridiales bacterium]